MEALINYHAVTIQREEQTLFSGIDLKVNAGEFVYLIGRVGSGKSTLLKTFYAEVPLEGGRAEVFEYDLRRLKSSQIPQLRRRLGIIFQDFQLLTDRTVGQNLAFVLRATGWKKKDDIEQRIREVLQQVGMENKGYRMPNTLSGGEQQRVVIARSLLNKPAVILADEPTGNLDPETGNAIVQLLYDISRQGTAVVMSTHNLSLISRFPGRVYRVEGQQLNDATDEFGMSATTISEPSRNPESEEEIQSDVLQAEDGNNNDEGRSIQPEAEPEALCHTGESAGKQFASESPEEPCTLQAVAVASPQESHLACQGEGLASADPQEEP